MNPIPTYCRRYAWLVCLAAAGCGGRIETAAAVDAPLARQTLEQVMQSWQREATPESWLKHEPRVVVQDLQWQQGARLLQYEILGDGEPVDANLHCQVKLKLQSPDGKSVDKTVTYIVGTDPVLTVFREIF